MKKIFAILLVVAVAATCIGLVACDKDKNNEPATFSVSWKNYNGDFIKFDPQVARGETPSFGQADPTRPEDEDNTYTFAGWNPAPGPISQDMVYTATYNAVPKPHNEVTASQFAAALDPFALGRDFSYTSNGLGDFKYKSDLSAYGTIVEDGELFYTAGFWAGDQYVVAFGEEVEDPETGDSFIYWDIDEIMTRQEAQLFLASNTTWLLNTIKVVPAQLYTYDTEEHCYKATYEGAKIKLTFQDALLVKIDFDHGGMTATAELSYDSVDIADDLAAAKEGIFFFGLEIRAQGQSPIYADDDDFPLLPLDGDTLTLNGKIKVNLAEGHDLEANPVRLILCAYNDDNNHSYGADKVEIKVFKSNIQLNGEYITEDGKTYYVVDLSEHSNWVTSIRVTVKVIGELEDDEDADNRIVIALGVDEPEEEED